MIALVLLDADFRQYFRSFRPFQQKGAALHAMYSYIRIAVQASLPIVKSALDYYRKV